MKKSKSFNLSILLILFLGIISTPINITADSGFDSSFDSGSSSFDSDSGGGSGSGSIHLLIAFIALFIFEGINKKIQNKITSGILIFPIYFILIALLYGIIDSFISIIFLLFLSGCKKYSKKGKKLPNPLQKETILELDPTLNLEEFNTTTFNIYKDIQYAWMNYDLETIKNLVSDEIYNMYSMQLETLKIKGQKNIMENITFKQNYITDIKFENNIETIKTIMTVECYDYIIDENNKVIRGNKNIKLEYTYELTFTKYTINKQINECPNCGAAININSTGKCEYCASTIINQETKWIMTKKQMLNQRRI